MIDWGKIVLATMTIFLICIIAMIYTEPKSVVNKILKVGMGLTIMLATVLVGVIRAQHKKGQKYEI